MSEISKADYARLDAAWKEVDYNKAESAMRELHNYLTKMKEAVIITNEIERLEDYPESAKGSNFDDLRIGFNAMLRAFNDWGECKDITAISL